MKASQTRILPPAYEIVGQVFDRPHMHMGAESLASLASCFACLCSGRVLQGINNRMGQKSFYVAVP